MNENEEDETMNIETDNHEVCRFEKIIYKTMYDADISRTVNIEIDYLSQIPKWFQCVEDQYASRVSEGKI